MLYTVHAAAHSQFARLHLFQGCVCVCVWGGGCGVSQQCITVLSSFSSPLVPHPDLKRRMATWPR
ncbi:UNVERIFIED_CONTAM: hypothetical protein FKN15_022121 [Acipenser sinensis]